MPSPTGSESVSAELLRAMLDQSADAMIYADREGVIRIWNRGAESIFGHAASEVLGLSLDVIIPERFRKAHWEGFRRTMETGHTKYAGRVMTTRSMHKDGSKLYVDLSFGMVTDASGAVAGSLAIGRLSARAPGAAS